jgi:hypothetical protein
MASLERILLFVMFTVILTSLFVPTLDSAISENGKNENLQDSRAQYETRAHLGVSDAQLSSSGSSTPPIVQWNATYGGTGQDDAFAFVQTREGGYALAGRKIVGSSYDFYVVEADASGKAQWEETYGGQYSDQGVSIVQASDGGYVVAGTSSSYSPKPHNSDACLIKIDKQGNSQWIKTYGESGKSESARSMVQTGDGGFVLAGKSNLDIFLVKTDSSGELRWSKTYPGTDYSVNSVVQTSDGGYAVAGSYHRTSTDESLAFLMKTDATGEMTWSQLYGARNCVVNSVVQTDDGGYALAGMNHTYGGAAENYGDALLVKTDELGNMTWSRNYGWSTPYSHEYAQSLVQTTDGGYALAARTDHNSPGRTDLYLVKTDADGELQWTIIYGGTSADYPMALVQTADGGYATAGITSSFGAGLGDFWLVKFSAPDDLYVASVEPMQVVLDAKALVANKSTAIRATISSTFESRLFVEINITYDFGRKWYLEDGPNDLGIPIDPGLNRVYIPGGPVKPTACPDPWIPSGQPPWLNWTSTGFDSNIRAVLDPLNTILESDETNNERTYGMKVVASSRLKILVVPIYFPWEGEDEQSFRMSTLKDKFLKAEMDFLNATFPIAEDQFGWELRDPESCHEFQEAFDPVPRSWWLNWILGRKYTVMAQSSGFDRVVIVVHDLGGIPGATFYGGVMPAVFVSYLDLGGGQSNPRALTADLITHEIGHTYYLQHPHDEGPEVYNAQRFWVARRLYEDPAYTFMGYTNRLPPGVPSDSVWIDKERYDSDPKQRTRYYLSLGWRWNLFDQLTTPDPEVIALRAVMFDNGTAKADEPWYRLPRGVPNLFMGDTGNYSIVLLDDEQQVLGTLGLNASFTYLTEVNGTWIETRTDRIPFDFTIPYIVGTSFVEIRNATDHILLSREVSSNSPIVNITFPEGGETLAAGTDCTINWESSDSDGDQLNYFVAYSANGGNTWIPLTLDMSEKMYTWNISHMKAGTNYLIKVIATDGVNTGEAVSNSFTILDLTPPSICISSPQNKTYFNGLIPLTFETNELTIWVGYSVDNQANITLNSNAIISLEDGGHQIVLYANDTSGNVGASESVYFEVDSSFYDPWKSSFIGIGGYPITDLAIYGGKLYAAADNRLYEYNGVSWNIIDALTFAASLVSYQDRLIIGGEGGLYSYDASTPKLIFSVSAYVKALGVYNNVLYAGTSLDKSPKLYYCNGTVENPSNWHMDTGFSEILNFSGPFGSIDSFEEYNGNMYVTSGGKIYCFNGTGWGIAKTYDDVYAYLDMKAHSGKLYLATRDQGWRKPLYLGGSGFSGRVIEFDGENWTTILDHDYWMYSLETYNNKLYAGTANKILIYNGTDWSSSFNALEGAYYAIAFTVFDGEIYVGMGNAYIFADPAIETALQLDMLPGMTIPEFLPTTLMPFIMILSLPLAFFGKKRFRKRFGCSLRMRPCHIQTLPFFQSH